MAGIERNTFIAGLLSVFSEQNGEFLNYLMTLHQLQRLCVAEWHERVITQGDNNMNIKITNKERGEAGIL
jgi:hypothetical protein